MEVSHCPPCHLESANIQKWHYTYSNALEITSKHQMGCTQIKARGFEFIVN